MKRGGGKTKESIGRAVKPRGICSSWTAEELRFEACGNQWVQSAKMRKSLCHNERSGKSFPSASSLSQIKHLSSFFFQQK